MQIHNFQQSLNQEATHADFWERHYNEFFGGDLLAIRRITGDCPEQRAGIDCYLDIGYNGNKTFELKIQEKLRYSNYPDILLEEWSDWENKTRGWIKLPLQCDFIAYGLLKANTFIFLPWQLLRYAWLKNHMNWAQWTVEAHNENNGRTWTTKSIAVPKGTLFRAMGF